MTISKSKIEEARNVSLVEYCDCKGFGLKPEGDGNYRIVGYSGLIIKDNYFYQFGAYYAVLEPQVQFFKTTDTQ